MIDKSARQHYAMQGKIRNYLGKQKMVKAPKKWKSGPDHPDTELAYITKAEKDLILKADLHSSLSKGPNRGPSGIISLNSAGSGYGGPGPGSSGPGGQERPQDMPAHLTYSPPAPPTYKAPDPVTETVPGDVRFEPKKEIKSIGPSLHGGPSVKEALDKGALKKMIRGQALEKMDYIPDDTTQLDLNKFGETFEPVKPDLRTEREKEEDVERATDWDKVKKLSDKGYDFNEIQSAMEKGLLTKTDPQSMKTNLLSRGIRSLRNIMPGTGLEKRLLGGLKKGFAQTEGGMFDPKKMAFNLAKNYGMKKLGLGFLNPWLGIASLFGFDPFKSLTNKFAQKPTSQKEIDDYNKKAWAQTAQTTDTRTAKARDAYKQPISTLIAEGKGLETETAKRIAGDTSGTVEAGMTLDEVAEDVKMDNMIKNLDFIDLMRTKQKGTKFFDASYNPKELEVAHGGRIDRPLTGRSRDI